ncbi:VOC family protein [Pseudooceanicola sp. MF1-13]|uniref:VOC family protein n=1 Tax=Pseudooceanicola sp. MF1-13 TaxID=3379095 RepID=UPI0038922C11
MKPFNPKTVELGYVALGSSDPAKQVAHYRDVLGLKETGSEDGTTYLSVNGAHHDIVLTKTTEKSFVHQGYQLRGDIELNEMAKTLEDAGFKAEIKSDSQPGVAKLVECIAPGGVTFQFYKEIDRKLPTPPVGVAPLRLGHLAIITPEREALFKFYEEVLGFHYTDDIGELAFFMTCNRDHHVVNVLGLPESRIHHIAFELRDNGEHVRAADILSRNGTDTLWGPSRHGAGHNVAAYHHDPDRVMIELYTQMDVYIPALGHFEPRDWHEEYPMVPKSWPLEKMTVWETPFGFNLAEG